MLDGKSTTIISLSHLAFQAAYHSCKHCLHYQLPSQDSQILKDLCSLSFSFLFISIGTPNDRHGKHYDLLSTTIVITRHYRAYITVFMVHYCHSLQSGNPPFTFIILLSGFSRLFKKLRPLRPTLILAFVTLVPMSSNVPSPKYPIMKRPRASGAWSSFFIGFS